ncbi:peptidylprolyl isomerase [Candidatus Magnetominusculus dajiuhuensis]|uniref:peptidylprolyl isomerase n=1 Tax=Candidatus Magnetominusculus dajiuhuensis TaxID=3137712 RepID=UPI003B43A8E1
MKKLLLMILAVTLLVSCDGQQGKSGGLKQEGTPVIKVNDVTITTGQLQEDLAKLPPRYKAAFTGRDGLVNFVDEIKRREVLYLEAKKQGIDKDPAFDKKLQEFARLNLVNALITKNVNMADIKVTPEEAKDYYDKNPKEFMMPDQIRASHILLKTEDEAKKVLEKVKKGGDFATVAMDNSIDKVSGQKGGDLGFFAKGQLDPSFDEAVFKLKKGEIGPVVKTQFGYHVIKVVDTKPSAKVEFEPSKTMIIQYLTSEKQKKAFDGYVAQIEKSYPVQVDQKALDGFMSKYTDNASKGQADTAPSDTTPIVKIGDASITAALIESELSKLPPDVKQFFKGKEGMAKLIEELKKNELLNLEAKKAGMDKDPEYVRKIEDYKKVNSINALVQKAFKPEMAQVTPDEVKAYYDNNTKDFTMPEQVKASHILVKTEEEAKAAAEKIQKGADFASVAKEVSIDKMTADKGGDLGFFSKGQMQPSFDEAAFKLKTGELSAPVKTTFGYHIIKLTDMKPAKKVDFDSAKDMITQLLTEQKKNKAFDDYYMGVEKGYNVVMDKKALDEFVIKNTSVKPEHGADTGGALPGAHPPVGNPTGGALPEGHPPVGNPK